MKNSKRNRINLIFSSFLVIGFIICTYFFSMLADQIAGTWGPVIKIGVAVLFGLLLFYATRVGEGKQVHRFSIEVLLLVVLPSIYIIAAGLIPALPLHDFIAGSAVETQSAALPLIMLLACIALGYGVPYTFLSGYELKEYEDEAEAEESAEPVKGGLAEELAEIEETEDQAETQEVSEAEPEVEADTETEPEEDVDAILKEFSDKNGEE